MRILVVVDTSCSDSTSTARVLFAGSCAVSHGAGGGGWGRGRFSPALLEGHELLELGFQHAGQFPFVLD